jgi:hypothetical protein
MFSGSGHDRGSGAHGQIDTPQAAGFEGNPVLLRDLSFLWQANLRRSSTDLAKVRIGRGRKCGISQDQNRGERSIFSLSQRSIQKGVVKVQESAFDFFVHFVQCLCTRSSFTDGPGKIARG